jgi:hypothetical protein
MAEGLNKTTTSQRSGGALVCGGDTTIVGFFQTAKLAFSAAHSPACAAGRASISPLRCLRRGEMNSWAIRVDAKSPMRSPGKLVTGSRPVGSFASACERVTGSRKRAQHLLVGRIEAGGSGFEENLNNAVNHFKLLWVALCEKRINALADISRVFFSLQEQKSAWGQSKTFGHGDDRVQAWHFVPTFHIPPEVSSDIASLRSAFEAEFRRLSKFSDPLCE